jgi:hypothetical protein
MRWLRGGFKVANGKQKVTKPTTKLQYTAVFYWRGRMNKVHWEVCKHAICSSCWKKA